MLIEHSSAALRSRIGRVSAIALATGLTVAGMPAVAQDEAGEPGGLREIVVSARRIEERLQDVPLSITAFDSQSLADNQINQVQDLGAQVPNLITSRTSVPGAGQIAIRGVSGQGLPRIGLDTRVGVYLDGVYLARSQGQSFGLADIERIEVLKGPQGTLFGRNVTAGSVNIITGAPKGEFGAKLEAGLGSRDRQRYRATLELPEAGGFSARITYVHDQQDGDIKNLAAGYLPAPIVVSVPANIAGVSAPFNYTYTPKAAARNFGDMNADSLFVAVRYEGVEGLTVDYKFDWNKQFDAIQNGFIVGYGGGVGGGCINAAIQFGTSLNQCTATGLPGSAFPTIPALADGIISTPGTRGVDASGNIISGGAQGFTVGTRRPDAAYGEFTGGNTTRSYGHNLTLNYEASDSLSLRSITAYRNLKTRNQADGDGGSFTLNNNAINAILVANGRAASYAPGGVTRFPGAAGFQGQNQHQFSQEFQAFGSASDMIDYLVGLYYFKEKGRSYQFNVNSNVGSANGIIQAILGNNGIPPYNETGGVNNWGVGALLPGDLTTVTSESKAIFGRLTFKPIENLDIVIGGRYTWDKKTGRILDIFTNVLDAQPLTPARDAPQQFLSQKFSKFTYDGTITYHVTPDVNVYARYATAYLAGGAIRNIPFNPETTKGVEAGLKMELFNRRVRFNTAVFYQKSKASQYVQTAVIPIGGIPGVTTVVATQLQNLGSQTVKGFEAELTAVPITGLTLSGSVGYTKPKYVTVPPLAAIVRPQTPPWTIQGSVQYDTPPIMGDAYLSLRFDANYRSRYSPSQGQNLVAAAGDRLPDALLTASGFPATAAGRDAYTNALNRNIEVGGFWVANARITLADIPMFGGKGRLSGFVKNMFDTDKLSYLAPYGLAFEGLFQEKRTYGLDLGVEF